MTKVSKKTSEKTIKTNNKSKTKVAKKPIKSMSDLAQVYSDELVPFTTGDVVKAKVLQKANNSLVVDVAGVALGIVPEKEFSYDSEDIIEGDYLHGLVVLPENEDGNVILSLKRADRERIWQTLTDKQASKEPIKIKISGANRGGLLVEFGGLEGFLPVSQLSSVHYPRVEGGDGNKILEKLNKLVGTEMEVKVLSADRQANKLIFSEKAVGEEMMQKLIEGIKIDSLVSGTITGIVDFGIFVEVQLPKSDNTVEGLIHISEVSWDRIDDLKAKYSIGDKVKAKVISTNSGRLSLSLKRLESDPWELAIKKIKEGEWVEGVVTRVTPFGAFVKINQKLDGLVHISELGEKVADAKDVVQEGENYKFRVLSLDIAGHKISLSLKKKNKSSTKKETAQSRSVSSKSSKSKKGTTISKKSASSISDTKKTKPKTKSKLGKGAKDSGQNKKGAKKTKSTKAKNK